MERTVRIPCPCPGTPHDGGDEVTLRERLGLAGGIAAQTIVVAARQAQGGKRPLDQAMLTGLLAEVYLLHAIEAWTLVGTDGRPLELDEANIRERLLSDFSVAEPIADRADDLYLEAVITPLVKPAASSSRRSSTKGSTSATRRVTPSRLPKRSKRSSTSTSPTAGTAATTTSPAGGSS